MSGNSESLILGSTETEATVKSKIVKWLQQVQGEENNTMERNLFDFWKERKDECDTLEFEKVENYFTATLWKIAAEYHTANLSHELPEWTNGKLPPWKDPRLWPK